MVKLTDEQWERIREHFPEERRVPGRAGRKPIPTRRVLEAVLWILNTGAQWHMLPQCYPNYKTVHRRFQTWCRHEVLRDILVDVANTLRERGGLDESESFIDAMFSSAKGGGAEVGPTKRGKGMKIMGIVDREGLPLSVSTHAANHHEVTLVQLSFEFYMIEATPERLIGEKAYDSDPLDAELKVEGVEMIAPHRKNRKRRKTQDGRPLRRYARRWKVERFFAWLQWQRRIVTRWEYYPNNFLGFVQLASLLLHGLSEARLVQAPVAVRPFESLVVSCQIPRRLSSSVARRRIRPGIQQGVDCVSRMAFVLIVTVVGIPDRDVQGRVAVFIPRVEIGARRNQELDRRASAVGIGGAMQGHPARNVSHFQTGACVQQRLDDGRIRMPSR